MNDVKYSTNEEKRLICSIQRAIGALDNGYIGTDTLTAIAGALQAECFPLTVKMYGWPVIVGRGIIPFSPHYKPLTGYANSMLGSFTYQRAVDPCSILISGGKIVFGNSCHAHIGKPESVIYQRQNGAVGVARVKNASELPADTVTAVGGMGLCSQYDPKAEGFTGAYADVTATNRHNVLGYKSGLWYGIYCSGLNGAQVNDLAAKKFKFSYAVMLDGGGLAAMNGAEGFARINTSTRQGYAIQFI